MSQQRNQLSNIENLIDELSDLCDSKEDVKMLNAVRNTCKKLDAKRSSKEILAEGPLRNLLENECHSIFEERDKRSSTLAQNLEKNVDQHEIVIQKNSETLSGLSEELEKLKSETKTLHNNLIGEISSVGEIAKSRIKSESERQTRYFTDAEEKHEKQIEGINQALDELDDRVNTGVGKLEESISNHATKLQDQQTALNKTDMQSQQFERKQLLWWKLVLVAVVLLIILDFLMGNTAPDQIPTDESPQIDKFQESDGEKPNVPVPDQIPTDESPQIKKFQESDGEKPNVPVGKEKPIKQQPTGNVVIPGAGKNQNGPDVDPALQENKPLEEQESSSSESGANNDQL